MIYFFINKFMNRTENIINRLNIWMNNTEYDDNGYLLSSDNEYKCKFENNKINVYHLKTNRRIAIISLELEFMMLDLTHKTEQEEFDNFILKQYTNSLIYRILSTV